MFKFFNPVQFEIGSIEYGSQRVLSRKRHERAFIFASGRTSISQLLEISSDVRALQCTSGEMSFNLRQRANPKVSRVVQSTSGAMSSNSLQSLSCNDFSIAAKGIFELVNFEPLKKGVFDFLVSSM
jgi:hypothetical protein